MDAMAIGVTCTSMMMIPFSIIKPAANPVALTGIGRISGVYA